MKTDNEPIRISYHRNVHYNSVVHPYKATIGVGLGLPALCPGSADRNLMQDATRVSERSHIEQTMFEDKIKVGRWKSSIYRRAYFLNLWTIIPFSLDTLLGD